VTAEPRRRLAEGGAAILGRPLAAAERHLFSKYLELLQKWNRVHRMVGSDDPMWITETLFLDSLLFTRLLPGSIGSLLDLGSGAGLPGIPIKLVRPAISLTMIESRRRRASFLSTVIRELELERATVIAERADVALREHRGAFDAVTMRCAGDPSDMMPLALEFVREGGIAVVSGPPRPTPTRGVEWVDVPGVTAGSVRRFGVARRPAR